MIERPTTFLGRVRRGVRVAKLAGAAAGDVVLRAILSPEDLSDLDEFALSLFERSFAKTTAWAKRERGKHCCEDCGSYGLSYVLKDEIWAELRRSDDGGGLLCLWCAERRLGRPIEIADLSGAPINDPVRYFLTRADGGPS